VLKNGLEAQISALKRAFKGQNITHFHHIKKESLSAKEKTSVYYTSCLDEEGKLEALAGRPLLDLLDGAGGWSFTQAEPRKASITDRESFQRRLESHQRRYQALGFFTWNVGEDDKNSSRHIIQVR